jgi:AraC-like DNA-binding protein
MDERPFAGRIEYGALGEMLLCKVAATNYRFTRSLIKPTPTLPIPMMLVSVSKGSSTFTQRGRTCILTEGDWTLIDTKRPLGYEISSPEIEAFVTMLPRPSDPAIAALCERGVARRSNGRWGLSRVLHAMVNESFGEMRRLPPFSERKLGAAIAVMAWDALREQIETPQVIGHRDELLMRLKAYIEANLADPDLSVERIAHACSISVRGLHRHFAEDPAGSVSRYLWQRRLLRCAEALRDPSQAHRSITDVCFSYGFGSSSHFSRLFKDRFGVSPVSYRVGLACRLRVIRDQY